MDRLDNWITGGRYSKSHGYVMCPDCEETTSVTVETEYGASTWEPEECKHCGREFTEDDEWQDDEPDCDSWEGE